MMVRILSPCTCISLSESKVPAGFSWALGESFQPAEIFLLSPVGPGSRVPLPCMALRPTSAPFWGCRVPTACASCRRPRRVGERKSAFVSASVVFFSERGPPVPVRFCVPEISELFRERAAGETTAEREREDDGKRGRLTLSATPGMGEGEGDAKSFTPARMPVLATLLGRKRAALPPGCYSFPNRLSLRDRLFLNLEAPQVI